jgi:hypothetical protein
VKIYLDNLRLDNAAKALFARAMRKTRGNAADAAALLGKTVAGLRQELQRLGVDPDDLGLLPTAVKSKPVKRNKARKAKRRR